MEFKRGDFVIINKKMTLSSKYPSFIDDMMNCRGCVLIATNCSFDLCMQTWCFSAKTYDERLSWIFADWMVSHKTDGDNRLIEVRS